MNKILNIKIITIILLSITLCFGSEKIANIVLADYWELMKIQRNKKVTSMGAVEELLDEDIILAKNPAHILMKLLNGTQILVYPNTKIKLKSNMIILYSGQLYVNYASYKNKILLFRTVNGDIIPFSKQSKLLIQKDKLTLLSGKVTLKIRGNNEEYVYLKPSEITYKKGYKPGNKILTDNHVQGQVNKQKELIKYQFKVRKSSFTPYFLEYPSDFILLEGLNNSITQGKILILNGYINTNSKLKINDDNISPNSDYSFKYNLHLKEGENKVHFNIDGNEYDYYYFRDIIKPEIKVSGTKTIKDKTVVYGTVEDNFEISDIIYINSKRVELKEKGKFKVIIDYPSDNKITLKTKDYAGNESELVKIVEKKGHDKSEKSVYILPVVMKSAGLNHIADKIKSKYNSVFQQKVVFVESEDNIKPGSDKGVYIKHSLDISKNDYLYKIEIFNVKSGKIIKRYKVLGDISKILGSIEVLAEKIN